MGATDLETRIQKYRDEAHDGGYVGTPLHTPSNYQRWQLWLKKS